MTRYVERIENVIRVSQCRRYYADTKFIIDNTAMRRSWGSRYGTLYSKEHPVDGVEFGMGCSLFDTKYWNTRQCRGIFHCRLTDIVLTIFTVEIHHQHGGATIVTVRVKYTAFESGSSRRHEHEIRCHLDDMICRKNWECHWAFHCRRTAIMSTMEVHYRQHDYAQTPAVKLGYTILGRRSSG